MKRPGVWLLGSLIFLGCFHHGGGPQHHETGSAGHKGQAALVEESSFPFTYEGKTRTVFGFGNSGPGVLLLHEINGLTPETQDLARKIAGKGYSVFVPLLFGKPGQTGRAHSWPAVCRSGEFYCFANHSSSPITRWLRKLVPEIEARSPGTGVGVIGMCLTGAFPLVLMDDPSVRVVVLSQPSLPFPLLPGSRSALGISPPDLDRARCRSREVRMLAFRFDGDGISPEKRFETLEDLFGDKIELKRFEPPDHGKGHAVLTESFVPKALAIVLNALQEKLEPGGSGPG